ncbi:unnamed protein product [Arctogadus glacialis]
MLGTPEGGVANTEMEMTSPAYSQQQAPPNQTAPWPNRTMTMHHYGNQNRPAYGGPAGGEGALLSQLCLVLRDLEGLEAIDHMLGIPGLAGQGLPLDQDHLLTSDPTLGMNPPNYSQLYPYQGPPARPQAYADLQPRPPGYSPMVGGPGMGGMWRSEGVRMAPQPGTLRLQLQHRLQSQNWQPIGGQMGGASNMNLPLRSNLPNQGSLNVQMMSQRQYLSHHLRQKQQHVHQQNVPQKNVYQQNMHLHQVHQQNMYQPNVQQHHMHQQNVYLQNMHQQMDQHHMHQQNVYQQNVHQHHVHQQRPIMMQAPVFTPNMSGTHAGFTPANGQPFCYGGSAYAGLNPSSPDPGKVLPAGAPRPLLALPSPMLLPRPQQAPPPAGSAYQTTYAPSGWTQPASATDANVADANVATTNSMYSHHQFQYSPQANGMYSSILSQGVTMETGAWGGPGQMSGHVTCIASEQASGGNLERLPKASRLAGASMLAGANMLAQES